MRDAGHLPPPVYHSGRHDHPRAGSLERRLRMRSSPMSPARVRCEDGRVMPRCSPPVASLALLRTRWTRTYPSVGAAYWLIRYR
ncbi:hypothetical protein PAXRUDRAFT_827026 [Paxillus rubicundulus Ve08.2h10]|uniref:Uncharacterized protein n=1 Tax=Paxillus rubicundulus Ve08.2h10 TaxID=930991 RepID=A0A0D0E3J8_9AGAM|nr:hypothetical protein PAXRUDRAFT_827026 [Paxillus rubicundulus Ve08.2h10]